MSKAIVYKYLIIVLLCLGCILRLTVFWVSPPNNSFDDHLEVIKIYSEAFNRPAPFQCWECYQPPLYYYSGAIVFKISEYLGCDKLTCWKTVQFINPILSISLLIISYQILLLFKINKYSLATTLSFIIMLPVDIFTSAMIGNDYMLVFFTILSFFFFLKTINSIKNKKKVWIWLVLLVLTATLGSLTKQHGLLIHLFPLSILFLLYKKRRHKKLYWAVPIFLSGFFLSISEEVWKFRQTGKFLVSNQDYYDFALKQFPGSLNKVEFLSFRIFELYKDPFISDITSASFFTGLFARTFYDYEWRFISPKIPWANTLGYIGYSVGLVWVLYFCIIIYNYLKQLNRKVFVLEFYNATSKISPILLAFLFALVPFIQTIRYPYFSSMKSMFMLSGIILLIITIGGQIKQGALVQKLGIYIIALNIAYAIFLVVSIYLYLGISLNHLHGPLWKIP